MHVGLIPDGNRRFMKKQGITKLSDSYNQGIERFHEFLEWCSKKNVDEVTIYALSLENINSRSPTELKTLLNVFNENALKALDDQRIHDNQIQINLCGDIKAIKQANSSEKMLENLEMLVEKTKAYKNLKLNLAIGYGGRQEIINAVKKIALNEEEFTEENIKKYLWINDYPDLIIRTSEGRLSNFLTWQSAYSEIFFVDCLWQEFTEEHLDDILKDYKSKERRFGR